MTDITEPHPYYLDYLSRWTLIYDMLEGEEAVKRKRTLYLPFPVALSDEVKASTDYESQYQIYLDNAEFRDFTDQAVSDLVAAVFSRDPIYTNLPEGLKDLDIVGIARRLTTELTSYGRVLIIAEYPKTDGQVFRDQEKRENLKPYLSIYNAIDFIHWKEEKIGGEDVLTRAVVKERVIDENNQEVEQYREFVLENNVYTVITYNDSGQLEESITPKANGSSFNRIPGVVLGVEVNNPDIDKPPILGIANTALKHYQTTAELRHSMIYQGHPMISITGAPHGFIDDMREQGVRLNVGASNAIVVEGEDSSASLLQISSDLVHFKELERLQQSIEEQGFKMTENKAGVESGKALSIRASGKTSQLAFIANQVERGLVNVLGFMAQFAGAALPEDFSIELVKNYLNEPPSPQLISTLSGEVNMGRIPDWVEFDYMKNVGLLDEDVDYDELRADSKPMDMGFGNNPPIDENTDGST